MLLGTYVAESIKASISAKEKVMKLVFEGNGGYDSERKSAREELIVGRRYTVEKIKVVLEKLF